MHGRKGLRLTLAGFAACLTLSASPAPALETTELAVGTARDPNLGTEMTIARHEGFFEDAGLDVEVKYFPSGGDLSAAVVGGSVVFGSAGSTPATTLRARFPTVLLARQSDISGAQQIVAKPAIKTPADFHGKRIAVMRGTDSEFLWDSFVRAFGVDASKVEVVTMGPTEMVAGFFRGDLDAISVWEPHPTRLINRGEAHVVHSGTTSHIPGKEGPNRIFGDHSVLYTTEAFLQDNPQTVRAVLEALARAVEFVRQEPEAATAILAEEFKMEPADMSKIMGVNDYSMALDRQLVEDLSRLAELHYKNDKIDSVVDVRAWIDPAPLRDVRPDWVQLDKKM